MTAAERLRARIAALSAQVRQHELALVHLHAELRRASVRARFELHHGRGLPAPTCATCAEAMSYSARSSAWRCHRCDTVTAAGDRR